MLLFLFLNLSLAYVMNVCSAYEFCNFRMCAVPGCTSNFILQSLAKHGANGHERIAGRVPQIAC